jgi:cellulose synthase operon protein C
LALLDEGLKRNPEQIGLRTLKAKIHVDKGETDKVLVLLEEIVQQEPSKLNHRYGLASFYASIKQLDEAEKVLRDAIALAPESIEPKLALAEFLLNRRDKTLAEKELLAFIQQEPGSYPLKFGLANLYEALGQVDKARNIYQIVIEMAETEPQGLTARTKLALLLFRNRDFEEVSRLLEEVLEENPVVFQLC